MQLIIVSPFYKKMYNVVWLELNTPVGNFVIQPNHAPMIITLTPHDDIAFGLKNGKQETLKINSGIAHITRSSATIVVQDIP